MPPLRIINLLLCAVVVSPKIETAHLIRTQIPSGSCICATKRSVNITASACGPSVDWISKGQCFKFLGAKKLCSVEGNAYEFLLMDLDNGSQAWVPSRAVIHHDDSLRLGTESPCHYSISEIPAIESMSTDDDGVCPKIVSRSEWRARAPKAVRNIKHPVPRVFIHHTETLPCSTLIECCERVRQIQNFHMDDRQWDDIGYNFIVGGDGNIYEGRGWDHIGAQVRLYNSESIGISIIGNYETQLPKNSSLTAVTQLVACGVSLGKLKPTYTLHGHRDGGCTSCPGQSLYDLICKWPNYGGQLPGHC